MNENNQSVEEQQYVGQNTQEPLSNISQTGAENNVVAENTVVTNDVESKTSTKNIVLFSGLIFFVISLLIFLFYFLK